MFSVKYKIPHSELKKIPPNEKVSFNVEGVFGGVQVEVKEFISPQEFGCPKAYIMKFKILPDWNPLAFKAAALSGYEFMKSVEGEGAYVYTIADFTHPGLDPTQDMGFKAMMNPDVMEIVVDESLIPPNRRAIYFVGFNKIIQIIGNSTAAIVPRFKELVNWVKDEEEIYILIRRDLISLNSREV